ncbi:uncharacterized protein LOC111588132 [Amphiprion ocellaris]|uniref:uncharacterized protein LOC111588132 n=1 Tax=Amphiprion ocellaris TaxID=80972 RepID=UPI002410F2FE|nr:uncharacterized protein LOC111588132 [Amphiprion ocellaris]
MPDKLMKSNLPAGGLPGENNEIFKSAAENERPKSTRYKQRKQNLFPTKSFYRKDSASPVNPQRSPSQDFSYYSGLMSNLPSLTSEQNIPEPKYKSRSRDSGYKTPSGFHRVTQAGFFHPKKPPNLNSYNKGLYVPRGQHYSPDLLPKHRDINHVPTVYQPASSRSLFSSYNNLFPHRRSGHVGIQTNSPHGPYNQMDRSHLAFPMKPSRSPHGSRGLNNYVGYHKVYNQNLVPAIHRPNDRTIIKSHGIDSTQSGTATHRVRNPLGSFSLPHRRGLSPNDGFVSAMRAGLLKTFVQPTNMKILQSTLNKPYRNLGYLPSQQLSEPISSLKNCVNWRNKKGPPSQRAQKGLQSYVNTYMKSKNRFARATTYLSNICYIPYQDATGMTAKLYGNMP